MNAQRPVHETIAVKNQTWLCLKFDSKTILNYFYTLNCLNKLKLNILACSFVCY